MKLKPIGIIVIMLVSVIALGCVESQPSESTSIENPKTTMVSTSNSNINTNPLSATCNFVIEKIPPSKYFTNGTDAITVSGIVINNDSVYYEYEFGFSLYDINNNFVYADEFYKPDTINEENNHPNIAYPNQLNEFKMTWVGLIIKNPDDVKYIKCTARPRSDLK